jgi:S-sulfo-L-cysteine synthase (O-acetyl-L-serine-dependent)
MTIGELRDLRLSATAAASLIGRTPLLRLRGFEREGSAVELYAKAEWHNPSGSVKARAAGRILADAERSGALIPGRTILDASSGNTGIAYALIGTALGYRVTICVPANVTAERRLALREYGADVILTDPLEGSDGAIREARARFEAAPSKYFYADQYNNDANWRAHYDTTAPEIWAETAGRITHFVAGLGTSGTFVGTSRRLREFNRAIRLVSFQPDAPLHGIEGLKHMASAIVPGIYDPTLADQSLQISTGEAYAMTRRLSAQGVPAGVSSGAAMVAVLRVASRLTKGVIVTIFPDGAERYVSERFWQEEDS